MKKGEKIFLGILGIFILILFLIPSKNLKIKNSGNYEKAEILDIKKEQKEIQSEGKIITIPIEKFKIKILSGKYKGQIKEIKNEVSTNPLNINFKKWDFVTVYIQEQDGKLNIQIFDYYRLKQVFYFFIFFLVVLILIGRLEGIKVFLTLYFSLLLIIKILFPIYLSGKNPIFYTLFISAIITIFTLLTIQGFHKKTIAAISGTILGVFSAFLISIIFSKILILSGLSTEDARLLKAQKNYLDLKNILISAIIIGALGSIMDIAVSISSSISEIYKANPKIPIKNLSRSGFKIAREVIGTMANTLIFAYIGSSLILLLLYLQSGENFINFLNFDFVAEEILRAGAGSIGLFLTVPITVIVASILEEMG